ncbi:DUF3560 domain-containing protein [Campylobacter ureolyticus]|uniref:DUF3560 domain-containing protein n=1 Tax=Campylobacter ureolyticus TaxID=827 RepID=UPI0022B47620|nr:DUF3560 domain-containing protein [Campylobacter ureolyticus]MCZ6156580.1 DUF3560 domain-containing protein [Campylobacter ureolyticus]
MNKFKKYCPNVWIAECEAEHTKGEIIELTTKYGKGVECEVYNLLYKKDNKFYYSIIRLDESYAQRRLNKHQNAQVRHEKLSKEWYEKSQEDKEFLSLGEPIKVGHHSEQRHRKLIEKNWERMGKAVEHEKLAEDRQSKIEYWEKKLKEINLSMPESLEYFELKLQEATERHKGLKNGTIPREYDLELAYANKAVRDFEKKLEIAQRLWA